VQQQLRLSRESFTQEAQPLLWCHSRKRLVIRRKRRSRIGVRKFERTSTFNHGTLSRTSEHAASEEIRTECRSCDRVRHQRITQASERGYDVSHVLSEFSWRFYSRNVLLLSCRCNGTVKNLRKSRANSSHNNESKPWPMSGGDQLRIAEASEAFVRPFRGGDACDVW